MTFASREGELLRHLLARRRLYFGWSQNYAAAMIGINWITNKKACDVDHVPNVSGIRVAR